MQFECYGRRMALFGLVHGGMHGAWCWDLLVPELERLGHRSVAVDLPCDDPATGCAEYAAVAQRAWAGFDEEIVVVGHSLAGLTIPLLPSLRPVARLVFLCALLPLPGMTYADARRHHADATLPAASNRTMDDLGRHTRTPEQAIEAFYHDVDPALAAWAISRLRPQAGTPTQEVTPLVAWPDTPMSYVFARDDRIVNAAWAQRAAPELLGSQPLALDGGHSPFLRAPCELAAVLDTLV